MINRMLIEDIKEELMEVIGTSEVREYFSKYGKEVGNAIFEDGGFFYGRDELREYLESFGEDTRDMGANDLMSHYKLYINLAVSELVNR